MQTMLFKYTAHEQNITSLHVHILGDYMRFAVYFSALPKQISKKKNDANTVHCTQLNVRVQFTFVSQRFQ